MGGWFVTKLAFNYLDRQLELASRGLAVEERKVAVEESRSKGPPTPKPMPPDLRRRVESWQDPDARDQERKVLLDLYAEHNDWDAVRRFLPTPPDERVSDTPDLGLRVA